MLTYSTTPAKAPVTGPPPTSHDQALVSRAEFNQLLKLVGDISKRSVRTETRVTRLLEAHGLDCNGQPIVEPVEI
jgi:hypothetical protein